MRIELLPGLPLSSRELVPIFREGPMVRCNAKNAKKRKGPQRRTATACVSIDRTCVRPPFGHDTGWAWGLYYNHIIFARFSLCPLRHLCALCDTRTTLSWLERDLKTVLLLAWTFTSIKKNRRTLFFVPFAILVLLFSFFLFLLRWLLITNLFLRRFFFRSVFFIVNLAWRGSENGIAVSVNVYVRIIHRPGYLCPWHVRHLYVGMAYAMPLLCHRFSR